MANAGMIIESHGETHIDLQKESDLGKIQSEVGGSKNAVQSITGQTAISIAYPGCVADKKVIQAVIDSGYLLSFSWGKNINHYYSNSFTLSRVHPYDDLENFKKLLVGLWEIPAGF